MSSINFFTPVIYNNQNKTTSQQVLEAVDEYFYLGDKPRVTIFSPDAEHPQSWASWSKQNLHRSWTNTALKVASYFTIIPPLVALAIKALLRRYLQVSSIHRVEPLSHRSRFGKLPHEMLQLVASFLSYPEQAQFTLVSVSTYNATFAIQKSMEPLNKEIKALPAGLLSNADSQRLLAALVTSPAAGHPKHWVPVMDALMGHLATNKVDGIIQKHANIADLLATYKKGISPDQVYQFCRYLGQKQLSEFRPWYVYRALEQYSLKPTLDSTRVNKALKEYLTREAEMHISADNHGLILGSQRFRFQEADIDPRIWFGSNKEENSLWTKPGAQNDKDEIAPMPELLLEVLWTRIQSLRASCVDKPFMVSMIGRAQAQLPFNFTLALAQRITQADIFLDHNRTIDGTKVENQQYARSLSSLSREEWEALAREHYPNAMEWYWRGR